MQRKSNLTSFLLSFIPGIGQIYLGRTARGLINIAVILFDILALFMINPIWDISRVDLDGYRPLLLAVIPVIWVISLVDCMILRDRLFRDMTDVNTLEPSFNDTSSFIKRNQNRKIIAMLLSVFPGAGHMYLGFMVQGIQLMSTFLFCFYLNSLLTNSIFIFFIPVIWFFSLFDAMQKVSAQEVEDSDILFFSWIKRGASGQSYNFKIVGYILIFVGLVTLMNRIAAPVLTSITNDWRMTEYIQVGLLAVIFIAGGFKFVRNAKPANAETDENHSN